MNFLELRWEFLAEETLCMLATFLKWAFYSLQQLRSGEQQQTKCQQLKRSNPRVPTSWAHFPWVATKTRKSSYPAPEKTSPWLHCSLYFPSILSEFFSMFWQNCGFLSVGVYILLTWWRESYFPAHLQHIGNHSCQSKVSSLSRCQNHLLSCTQSAEVCHGETVSSACLGHHKHLLNMQTHGIPTEHWIKKLCFKPAPQNDSILLSCQLWESLYKLSSISMI